VKHWMILAAASASPCPPTPSDWEGMLKGVTSKPATQPSTSGVDALSNSDINAGLKEALTRGADAAVTQLGQKDGFFGNAALKIRYRPACRKPKSMRPIGMGAGRRSGAVDDRAAEAAVRKPKPCWWMQ